MIIERTNDEIIIRILKNIVTDELQRIINFLNYKEATASSKTRQKDVDKLSSDVNKHWWSKHSNKFPRS